MSHTNNLGKGRGRERVIQLGDSIDGRYRAQLLHDLRLNTLSLRVYDSEEGKEILLYHVLELSRELFAAYRAIAEVTKGDLERLNQEFEGEEF